MTRDAASTPHPGGRPEIDAAAHERLVAALMRHLAATQPGAAPRRVRTHISSLILTEADGAPGGEGRAYKLKRPVRLPFLDFSTRARRRHFCEEELRLNRRTAPDLYLDVVPVTGSVEAPVIDGEGEAIDWVLRMRRFDPGDELRVLAVSGALAAADIDALAAHLAAFHAALPPLGPRAQPAKTTWQWASESLDELLSHPGRPAACSPQAVAALRGTLGARFDSLASLQRDRAAHGFVREGHGDLHLGNLVRWRGQVMAFDAIEFDPALRCIDVIDDVAFTYMDLRAHGLAPLAWRFINAWAERTGDYAGLPLLDAFAAYRALVRAKVALLDDDSAGFARYWPLATRLAQAAGTPRLMLTMGLSGSGKSTVARLLAEGQGAIRVRSDVERKRLHGLAPMDRVAPGSAAQARLYGREATRRTYARLGELTGQLLAGGLNVVVDAACLRQDEREAMRQLARRHGAAFTLVSCTAPQALLLSRLEARTRAGDDPSDATPEVLALQQRVQEPVPADWAACTRIVINDGDLDTLRERVARLEIGQTPENVE